MSGINGSGHNDYLCNILLTVSTLLYDSSNSIRYSYFENKILGYCMSTYTCYKLYIHFGRCLHQKE